MSDDLRTARRERDEALAALNRERALVDALFRRFQRLASVVRKGPAGAEADAWREITRIFEERNT